MIVPFVDLKSQYNTIKKQLDKAIYDGVHSFQFIQGKLVEDFEKQFADYIGARYCISVNSGTDALILGIRALDFQPGDEIILPANTFFATALGISENGLTPVFVDCDENDFGINLEDLKKKITKKTKAIIPVHLYGQSDKLNEIKKIIKGTKILIIEDACQSHGAEYKNKRVGTFGLFSAFSFYPGKNLGAYGDGGAIVTNDSRFAQQCRLLREYGQSKKYYHDILGINSRLDTIQASILLTKLKYLDKWNEQRQKNAALYTRLLSQYVPQVITPNIFIDRPNIYHLYVIRAPKRDQLIKHLQKKGIIALIHYPFPLHLQKAYQYLGYKKGSMPITEKLANDATFPNDHTF